MVFSDFSNTPVLVSLLFGPIDRETYTGVVLLASSTPTSTLTWITWFCSLPGHEYFCEVTEDFIEDDFNLTGLNTMVPFWKEAMEMVLDVEAGVGFYDIWISPDNTSHTFLSLR